MDTIIQPGRYTFDASAKTITFADYNPVLLGNIKLITNVRVGIVIFNFADPMSMTGSVLADVLTLDYDTTLMNDSDPLMIIYWDPLLTLSVSGNVTANAGTNLNTSALALETTLQLVLARLQIIDDFVSGARGLVTEDNSAAILARLQVIDDFISGARGLVTEDNSAAILARLQVIDDFISGARGLVTEDNSAAILVAVQALSAIISGGQLLVLETNSAAIKTAVEKMDDVVVVEDAALAANPSGVLQTARKRELLVSEGVAEGDAIALNATEKGELLSAITDLSHTIKRYFAGMADLAQLIRAGNMLGVDLTTSGALASITSISSVSSVTTVSGVTSLADQVSIGGKNAVGQVDNIMNLNAEMLFNRILTY